jgi:hypothetical protein
MAAFCSFRRFLRTGQLGPLHHGLTTSEVAALLGAAPRWSRIDSRGMPDCWSYGRLDLSFGARSGSEASRLDAISIRDVPSLRGDCEVFRVGAPLPGADAAMPPPIDGALAMTLDGLDEARGLADVLDLFRDRADTRVLLGPFGEFNCPLRIVAGVLLLEGVAEVEPVEDGPPLGGFEISELIRRALRATELISVTAVAPEAAARLAPSSAPAAALTIREVLESAES